MKKGSVGLGITIGILLLILLTALAVGLLMSGGWLYRLEIDPLHIETQSGLSRESILDNYNAVIRFLSPFHSDEFKMPTLSWSGLGARHFEEVKVILLSLYAAGFAAFLVIAALYLLFRKRIGRRTHLTAAVTVLILPLLAGGGIALNFDGFFVLFHKVFFNNDYWIFDASTDPVINILPSEYFMHCAIVIALFWLLGSAACSLGFLRQKKKDSVPEIHHQSSDTISH